jgi:AAA+ ATPase superfamily predicted ATPase
MGKTGLIQHVFYLIRRQEPKTPVIYLDLFPTENLADFTQTFASAVIGQLDSSPVKVLKKAITLFKGLRPTLTVDELTGNPRLGLDIARGSEASTLEQVFNYLKEAGKTCYIAFDEFQQIGNYPEQNVEALLRSYVQNLHNVRFIFSGSQTHMLQEMFLSPKRPFYQSTDGKHIGAIPENAYYEFASAFFQEQGRVLPEDVFHYLYQRYEGHTWYLQMILNRLYATPSDVIDEGMLLGCIRKILSENEYYYQHLLQVYPQGQVKLIKAIAQERKVSEITAGAFIAKYGLTAASSVKSALTRMLEEEIVYRSDGGYIVYDRFFGDWLRSTQL